MYKAGLVSFYGPSINEWTDAIMFIETSEDKPSPDFIKWTFRNFAAQEILKVLKGIIVGKPQGEKYYPAKLL
jgi:muramoyltetrapeptide carboxypeptidase LdcA involved in peptidoglycan recycling